MFKSKICLFVIILLMVGFSACERDLEFNTPSFSEFVVPSKTATYYISNSANSVYKIPIGITKVSDKDRTLQLTYSSPTGATAGTQYNAPATVVIPAGKVVDTLAINGIFAGYTSSRKDTLQVTISGGDIPANSLYNTFNLVMRKYCDVNLNDLAGDYTNTVDNGSYGPYAVRVTAGTATGTTGFVNIANIWDPGVPTDTKVNIDWTNPANFTATIPDQVYYGAADLWIVGTAAGSFSSCDQTFTLKYKLYFKSTGAVYYNNQTTVIGR
jgi:hypothetical protein